MADQKVSGLPLDTDLDDNHYVVLNDPTGPTTKRTTLGTLRVYLQAALAWVTGSMIANGTIRSNNIDFTTAGKVWWEELARVTLGSAGLTANTPTFTARKYLMILVVAKPSGGVITPWLRFNGDTGNNYALRYGANFAAGTNLGSQNGMSLNPASINSTVMAEIYVENEAAVEKPVYINAHDLSSAGAANAPNSIQSSAKWANTAALITSVNLFNSGGTNLAAGTELIVLGHD